MVAQDEHFHHIQDPKAPRRCHCGSETAQSETSLARRITDVASPIRRCATSISSSNSCVKFNNRQSVPNSFASLCRCGENRFWFIDHCSLIFKRSAEAYGNTLVFTTPGPDGLWFTDDDVQSDDGANENIYCGYRFDPESQLYYVRNRTYNPALGRWIQRDPIGYAGGINLYGYVESAPVGSVDAWGRKWVRLNGVEYCEAYYAGSWSPIPAHAFIFVSGHEYGFFPKLPPSGLPNEIRDLIYEDGIIHIGDGYSCLHEGDKGPRTGVLYRQCYDVEVNDCIMDPGKALMLINAAVHKDLKHPPHYSYLLNHCVDWAHGVIRNGVVNAEISRCKNDARPDLLRYVSPRKAK